MRVFKFLLKDKYKIKSSILSIGSAFEKANATLILASADNINADVNKQTGVYQCGHQLR